jgi:polysaccharide pyruvyl transferase WcaK-like protein
MRVLLLNDTSNWYHYGCTATSSSLIDGIKQYKHIVTSVPITKTYEIKFAPNTKVGFLDKYNIPKFMQANPEIINLVIINDILIINGEGTLHGLNQAPLSLLYLAYIAKVEFGKNVQILNHSAYPEHSTNIFDSEESAIYKLVYSIIDYAAIREPISFNTMKKLDINLIESFDCMPLYIKNHYVKSNIKHSKNLLIAGSASWLQLDVPSKTKGNISDFLSGLSGFNQYLQEMQSKGFKIKFLYGSKLYPAKDDREFIGYMQKHFCVDWEIYEAKSLDDWLRTIDESTFLVSGRFHHTIAAACLGTKFIALGSNTPKMDGLMQVLESEPAIKYNSCNIYNELLLRTKEILDFSRGANNLVDQTLLDYLCQKAEKNFEGLNQI